MPEENFKDLLGDLDKLLDGEDEDSASQLMLKDDSEDLHSAFTTSLIFSS